MPRSAADAINAMLQLFSRNRLDELERLARSVTHALPAHPLAWQMLGVSLLGRGRAEEAREPLERAARLAPANASVWDNLGLALLQLGRLDEARRCLERAVALQPGSVSAWVNLSAAARGTLDVAMAEKAARRALDLNERSPQAHLNLANALVDGGRVEEAETHLRAALELSPGWAEASLTLAVVLERCARLPEAETLLVDIVAAGRADWRVFTNLGRIRSALGNTHEAVCSYERALELNPAAADAFSGLLFLRLHDEGGDPQELARLHRSYGDRIEAPLKPLWPSHANVRDPDRRLRVGIVSGDLRKHAVAHFIEPYLEAFRDSSLEVFVYANQRVHDEISERLKAHVAQWRRVIELGDANLAALIQRDAIDVLVDLSGHTALNRLPVFARKPAPVQLSWLGYPGTTGLTAVDYRLMYAGAAPRGLLDDQFVEKILYLPVPIAFRHETGSRFDPGPLPARRNGFVTFANLNRLSKTGSRPIAVWSEILTRMPEARMLIGAVNDASTADRVRSEFATHGIGAERLDLRPYLPMDQYVEMHREIDLMLDSFPYAGGTTNQHAIRLGVPIVGLAGPMLPQRSGAGVLHAVGLGDWVAESEADYVATALEKARDLDGLERLRADLPRRWAARDPEESVRCLEAAIRLVWRRWCEGLPPETLEVPCAAKTHEPPRAQ